MPKGGSLAMVAHGIGILLIIKNLKTEFADATHPWYDDDSDSLGTFANVKLYFNLLKRFGPRRGYYPKPSKRILILYPENLSSGNFGLHHGFKVFGYTRYPGIFLVEDNSKLDWLKENTQT